MADLTPQDPLQTPSPEVEPPEVVAATAKPEPKKAKAAGGGGLKGFLAKPSNRIVAIVGAVIALLAVLGVAAAIVLAVVKGKPAPPPPGAATGITSRVGIGGVSKEPSKTVEATSASTPRKPTASKPATTTAPKVVSLLIPPSFEVFTQSRDPFKPGFIPGVTDATTAGTSATSTTAENGGSTNPTSSESGGTTDIKPGINVLFLSDITGSGSSARAVVFWSNVEYTVKEGARIDDSPWKLVSLGSSSGTFLYGDDRVTLRVGEQLGK